MVVGYEKEKYINLTPSKKKLGKLLGRGSKAGIARSVVEAKDTRAFVVKEIAKLIRREIKVACSDNFGSMLRDTTDVALANFSWESVWHDMTSSSPVLFSILEGCLALPHKSSISKKPVICMIFSMLAKFRNPKMSQVQAAISLILRAGHAGSQVNQLTFQVLGPKFSSWERT